MRLITTTSNSKIKNTLTKRTAKHLHLNLNMVKSIYFLIVFIEREPMLFVDVNLGNSGTQRITVYDGDTAEGLAE